MTKRLAIIPARGGSKRIPRKNMKLFRKKFQKIHTFSLETAQVYVMHNFLHFHKIYISLGTEELVVLMVLPQLQLELQLLAKKKHY